LNLCRQGLPAATRGPAYRTVTFRRRGSVLFAAALLACVAGCSAGDASLTAGPQLTRYSWGTEFTSTNPQVSFPLPPGWKRVDGKTPGGDPNTVRLQSAEGACQLLLTRAPAGESAATALQSLRMALSVDGRNIQEKGRQQVGNLQARRFDVDFGKGLTEEVYGMQTGSWLLTLITVHSPRCGTEFDDTLRGFRG
jgi:hypothetical protein